MMLCLYGREGRTVCIASDFTDQQDYLFFCMVKWLTPHLQYSSESDQTQPSLDNIFDFKFPILPQHCLASSIVAIRHLLAYHFTTQAQSRKDG